MPRIVPFKIKFTKSAGSIAYRMFFEEAPEAVTYDSTSLDFVGEVDSDGFVNVDLADVFAGSGVEGSYNIGIAAFDDRGNESAMSKADNVPLDFRAPAAPGPIVFL